MTGWRTWGLGGGVAVCLAAGSVAGLDAARHVDGFYTAPRVHEARALPPVPQSSAWDWDMPPASSTTWASATEGQSVAIIGEGRGDGSDLTAIDRAIEQAAPVRVHRPRHAVRVVPREDDLAPPAETPDEAAAPELATTT